MIEYDAIVIGTGQSGPSLAKRLAGAGMKVAIIERAAFGGTCINTGCTPTKTLVASAYAAHLARRGAEFGVLAQGDISVDMKRVKARKDAVVSAWTAATEASLRDTQNCTVYRGHARFASSREVALGGELLSADRIFIDVGGRAAIPPIPGLDQVALSHEQLDAGPRYSAGSSGRGRGQLCWARIRPDVPALRQRGDGDRGSAATDPARGRGDFQRCSADSGIRRGPRVGLVLAICVSRPPPAASA